MGKQNKNLVLENVFSTKNLFFAYEKVREKNYIAMRNTNLEKFEKNISSELSYLQKTILDNKYIPQTARGIKIPKKNTGKFRDISLMDFRDRIVQRTLANSLASIYEGIFLDCSYAYRPRKSVKMALTEVNKLIKNGYIYVLDADLKDFFSNLHHDILLNKLSEEIKDIRILSLIKRYLQQIEYKDSHFKIMEKGVKQGSIISPILSNIYLHSFDKAMRSKNYKLIRYADDFIILTKTKEELIKSYACAEILLELLALEFNKDKTRVLNLSKGHQFKFLGEYFDKEGILRKPDILF